ncbi:MAG: hypothetical protein HY747_00605 [Elusimicrobia bacterium]|nr:hypothetical protein [Elusimicrobiota bacterium]
MKIPFGGGARPDFVLWNHVAREHVFINALAAAGFAYFLGWRAGLAFWSAGVLIDFDHYIDFVYRTRAKFWGFREMFFFHTQIFERLYEKDFLCMEIFHTVEFMAGLTWLAVVIDAPVVWAALAGAFFHHVLDFFHLARRGAWRKRAFSFLEYLIRVHRMKRLGIDGCRHYQKAIEALSGMAKGQSA